LTTGRIAVVHGRLNSICQVAPVCTPPNTCFLGPTRVLDPNGISIGSAVFAGLTSVTDRQTDRPRYSICNNIGRICIGSTAMRPKNRRLVLSFLLPTDTRVYRDTVPFYTGCPTPDIMLHVLCFTRFRSFNAQLFPCRRSEVYVPGIT